MCDKRICTINVIPIHLFTKFLDTLIEFLRVHERLFVQKRRHGHFETLLFHFYINQIVKSHKRKFSMCNSHISLHKFVNYEKWADVIGKSLGIF